MPLFIEQYFPLGRFHATRWRENPFTDSYGEWPPSPWRLLRTLAARWFQYSRETGDRDEGSIEDLLRILGSRRPSYFLPPSSTQGTAIKQYQPISEHAWSDPNKGSGAVKRAKTTLFPDGFFAVDPALPVIWQWPELDLNQKQSELLRELLARVTYFGRAESISRLRVTEKSMEPNCVTAPDQGDARVLCFREGSDVDISALLSASDSTVLADAPVPPGTEWVAYQRPTPERVRTREKPRSADPVRWVQFAVGGHVFPRVAQWIKVTERFRGSVLKVFAGAEDLRPLLAGKDARGIALGGEHEHPYYLLWPSKDDCETPSRLIVWRRGEPFHSSEIEAMMRAARKPVNWVNKKDGWNVQLVPLPASTGLPRAFGGESRVWESLTPFARPHNRHFRRANGKSRPAETPEAVCVRLIEKIWGIRPISVDRIREEARWVKLHETSEMRSSRKKGGGRTPHVGPGYYLRVTFEELFRGPLIVGDSAHFGLGVFGIAGRNESGL